MKKFLTLSVVMLALLGCKKDKGSGTKPVLTFKSASATDIPKEQQEYYLYFNVKDGDGDLEGTWNVVDLYHYPDITKYDQMPMPKLETHKGMKLDAEMILIMSDVREGNFLPAHWPTPVTTPDTSQLRIFVLDNEGNSSDTITLPKIVIRN